LKSLKIPTELYLDGDAGHGLDSKANYGLSTNNTDTVRNYIIERATTFFQSVLNNTAGKIKKTLFLDCRNNRTVCLMKDSSCTNSITNFISNAVSRTEWKNDISFKVYAFPNPSPTAFTLKIQSSSNEEITIIVTDIFGKKVYMKKLDANETCTFGKTFANGIYFVQARQGADLRSIKIIKE
jgi:hypothetical protein